MAKKTSTAKRQQKITGFLIDPTTQRVTKVSIGSWIDDAVAHALRLHAGESARSRQFIVAGDDAVDGLLIYEREPSHPSELDRVNHLACLKINDAKLVLYGRTLLMGFTFAGSCESSPLTLEQVKASTSFAVRSYTVTHPDGAVQLMKPNDWANFLTRA